MWAFVGFKNILTKCLMVWPMDQPSGCGDNRSTRTTLSGGQTFCCVLRPPHGLRCTSWPHRALAVWRRPWFPAARRAMLLPPSTPPCPTTPANHHLCPSLSTVSGFPPTSLSWCYVSFGSLSSMPCIYIPQEKTSVEVPWDNLAPGPLEDVCQIQTPTFGLVI